MGPQQWVRGQWGIMPQSLIAIADTVTFLQREIGSLWKILNRGVA